MIDLEGGNGLVMDFFFPRPVLMIKRSRAAANIAAPGEFSGEFGGATGIEIMALRGR